MEPFPRVVGLGLVDLEGGHRKAGEEDAYYARYSSAFALPAWLKATADTARKLFAHRPNHHDVTTSRPHVA